MIFYGGEDPATGSAAGPAGAWMVRHGWAQPGESVVVEQGLEMRRPSRIFVRVGGTAERPSDVRVGGSCFEVMQGALRLPVAEASRPGSVT
jgi:trans-2,3-dihydro-3-hydroxyanthranilate isomerase